MNLGNVSETSLNDPLDTRKLRQWPWYSNQAKNKEEEGWRWGWRVWAHSRLQWRGGWWWWWRYVFSFLHSSNEASHHWQVQSLNTADPKLMFYLDFWCKFMWNILFICSAETISTSRTLRGSPASLSRAGGRTKEDDFIMPTSWTTLQTNW